MEPAVLERATAARSSLGIQNALIGKTFFYRNEHKRVIEAGWRDEHRLRHINGLFLYAVTDS